MKLRNWNWENNLLIIRIIRNKLYLYVQMYIIIICMYFIIRVWEFTWPDELQECCADLLQYPTIKFCKYDRHLAVNHIKDIMEFPKAATNRH